MVLVPPVEQRQKLYDTLWFVKKVWFYNMTHRLYRCVSLCRGFSICDGSSHRHPILSLIGQLEPLTGGATGHLNDATTFLNFIENFLHLLSSCHFGPFDFGGFKEGFHLNPEVMGIQQPSRCSRTIWKVEGGKRG